MKKPTFATLTVAFFMTFSAAGEVCGSQISYVVISRRNANGQREIVNNLTVNDGNVQVGDVRHEVQHRACTVFGVSQLHINTLIHASDTSPPAGYELVPELGWYRLYLTPRTWDEARLACEAEGAHLAVLNSPQEAEALKGIFARAPDVIPNATYRHVAHIGFKDLVEGHYRTIFGQTLPQAGFAEWGASQPNNAGGATDADADCGGIERSGKLNDLPCRSRDAYFCEFPL